MAVACLTTVALVLVNAQTTETLRRDGFSLTVPGGWRTLPEEQVARLRGRPLAALRRQEGKGLVMLRRGGRLPVDLTAFSGQLDGELGKRVPGFRRLGASKVTTGSGRALFYSYTSRGSDAVHAVVLFPDGGRSYVMNATWSAGARESARELDSMVASFSS